MDFKNDRELYPTIELLNPKQYLIDFIELSGIKQEEAIGSL
jgi:hypothetical protein